ncbi:MAG: hypothetical protein Q7S53_05280 [bacterium]|nr:hypothetical protein [bacterium]
MENKEQINSSENGEDLSTLKESLRQAIDDGDVQRAGELKEEIIPHLEALKEKIRMPFESAKEIMGEDYLGPEAVEETFGIKLKEKNIPTIPFSKEELEMAKRNGQFLILRVNEYKKNREPMNIRNMRYRSSIKGLEIVTAVQSDSIPRAGWALVKSDASFAFRDYLRETEDLAQYISLKMDEGLVKSPEKYVEALYELENKKPYLESIMRTSKPDANLIADLQVNRLGRQSISEAVYDTCVYYKKKGALFFGDGKQVRTNTVSPLGGIMELHMAKDCFVDGKLRLFVGAEECSYISNGVKFKPAFVFARRS